MQKNAGFMLVVFAAIMAFGSVMTVYEDFTGALFGLFIIGLPLYMIGHIMRAGWPAMKKNGFKWIWSYIYLAIIVPALLLSFEEYEELKEQTFSDKQFILYESAANPMMNGFSLLIIMLLLLLFTFPFYIDQVKRKWLLYSALLITLLGYTGYQYVMWTDYRGVHETEGLITHKWNGRENRIPYDEIRQITIEPYIHYPKLSNPSDEKYFAWKIIFVTEQSEDTVYHFRTGTSSIEKSGQLKQFAASKNLPVNVIPLTPKERSELEFQIELNDLEPMPFHQFFEL